MDLKETDILDDDIGKHWYYRSKAKAMSRMISPMSPDVVLDVGAGSGFFSKYLLQRSAAKEAWCVDTSYEDDTEEMESGKPIFFRRSIDSVDADLVLLMDVLEHVDDDVGLLREYVERVPSGSRFLISVPAFQFMWSGHDVFLEHKRRYRLQQVERVARASGLTVERCVYYFGGVFPIAAVTRLVGNALQGGKHIAKSQLSRHHPLTNGALAALSSAELPLLKANRLAGLTVFCLAEKR
jgi:SAM-dependent methyltransferase